MGRFVFKLPDVGEGTAEAEIVAWRVAVGDRIEEDTPLVDVMTDKATVEMTSPVSGIVRVLNGEVGEMAAVGAMLAELEVEGPGGEASGDPVVASPTGERNTDPRDPPPTTPLVERPSTPSQDLGRTAGAPPAKTSPPAPKEAGEAPAVRPKSNQPAILHPTGDRPLASPAVRRRAHDLGVNLLYVPGSGPAGRVDHGDLDAFLQRGEVAGGGADQRYAARDGVEDVKVIGLRRRIAQQMQESKRRIPHFAYVEEIDMTALEDLRAHLNATHKDRAKLTVLPFLMRALVKVLPDYPQINATFDDEAGVVHRHRAVHIGIATQTPNGLIVPVVRHAEALDLWQAATEVTRLSAAARDNKASREELSGSTITLTSLGPLGGVVTTPVINHPEVGIIGPNKIVERPVVRGGQVVIRKMMNLSSSFDHRVVDGYDAAEFIQRIKALLENPATLFIE